MKGGTMASKQLAWTQLRVGLLVIVSLTIFAVFIFLITGEGFFQRKYELRTYMEDAGGLRTGDPVRLAGIDAGNVLAIRVSGSHDPKRSVEVTMRVLRRYQDEIRGDSLVSLAAEGLLGQRYLDITRGNPSQAVIAPEGEVKLKETAEISDVVATSADVMVKLNRIAARVDNIMNQVESGKGSLGKMIYDESLFHKANKSVDDIQRLVSDAASGKGSLGKFLTNDQLYNDAQAGVTKVNQVLDDVQKGQGSLGKLIYDPGVYDRTNKLLARVDTIVGGVEKGQGTLGKLIKEEALYERVNSAAANIDKVSGRLERGEGSAGKLLHDESLYNNLNSFTLDLRGLLADFRQNPKKFLTIQLKIF
jgi:phospholipid/cholesterol/gamma-HCH transport system substrate-binding protein